MYDPGSNVSFISQKLIKRLKQSIIKSRSIFKSIAGLGSTRGRAVLKLKIGEIEEHLNVHIVKSDRFTYDLLLGMDAVKRFKLIQDKELQIHQKVNGVTKKLTDRKVSENAEREPLVKYANFNKLTNTEEFEVNLENLSPERKAVIQRLIDKHYSIFAKNKFDIGRMKNYEAQIKLLEEKYVSKKPTKVCWLIWSLIWSTV